MYMYNDIHIYIYLSYCISSEMIWVPKSLADSQISWMGVSFQKFTMAPQFIFGCFSAKKGHFPLHPWWLEHRFPSVSRWKGGREQQEKTWWWLTFDLPQFDSRYGSKPMNYAWWTSKNLKDFTPGVGCRGEGSRAMLPALVLQPWLAAVGGSRGRTTDVHRKYFKVYPEKRGYKKNRHLFVFRKLLDRVSGVWASPLIQPLVMYRVVLHRLRCLHQNHLT